MPSVGDTLPQPGPPFHSGDEVAFFPAEIEPLDNPGYLGTEFAVIDDVDERSETIDFHFVSKPEERGGQGMENVVRRSQAYFAWRTTYEAVLLSTRDVAEARSQTEHLRRRVLAEHPLHGVRLRHALEDAERRVTFTDAD